MKNKRQRKGLFFVTCIDPKFYKEEYTTSLKRCWGWYKKLKNAIRDVKKNYMDIHETKYTYCVIEEVPEEILPIDMRDIIWFKWNSNKEQYEKCKKPDWAKQIIGWSIG
jgi:hypothetical protein